MQAMSYERFFDQPAGSLLVALQLLLIALLGVWAAPEFFALRAPPLAWVLAGTGIALGLWTLAYNRPGNFHIRPAPHRQGRLICDGPYRWVRHPMYSAILCCALAGALAIAALSGWLAAGALGAVLVVKLGMEEVLLLRKYAEYDAYRARTWRLLPGLF